MKFGKNNIGYFQDFAFWRGIPEDVDFVIEEFDDENCRLIGPGYGDSMSFTYGNEPGKCSFHVYRIAMTNEDGVCVDLSDCQMRKRCQQLGLNPVPFICEPFIYDGDLEALKSKLNALLDKPSILDQKHVEEGVCIRWDDYPTCKILKLKSFVFLGLEDEQKSNDNFVDKEEIS